MSISSAIALACVALLLLWLLMERRRLKNEEWERSFELSKMQMQYDALAERHRNAERQNRLLFDENQKLTAQLTCFVNGYLELARIGADTEYTCSVDSGCVWVVRYCDDFAQRVAIKGFPFGCEEEKDYAMQLAEELIDKLNEKMI